MPNYCLTVVSHLSLKWPPSFGSGHPRRASEALYHSGTGVIDRVTKWVFSLSVAQKQYTGPSCYGNAVLLIESAGAYAMPVSSRNVPSAGVGLTFNGVLNSVRT